MASSFHFNLEVTCTWRISFLTSSLKNTSSRFLQSPDGDYVGELNCSSGFRQGWGEMRWANGSLYGPGNIFIYSQGDRYYGQWVEDRQEGEGNA